MKIAVRRPARGSYRPFPALVAGVAAALVAFGAVPVAGQGRSRPPAETRRSRPVDGAWDRLTSDTFVADAFSTLEVPRPAFAPNAGAPPADVMRDQAPGAVRWSALVSADTLTDEIKDAKATLEAACKHAGAFKAGGFETARVSLGTLAVAFGVIAAYDGDARWKNHAAAARDLCAETGFACTNGTDAALSQAKARLEDLAAMLEGGAPAAAPPRPAAFRWSETADRPTLMVRLQRAFDTMRSHVASATDFERNHADLVHAAEIVAVLGELLQQPDFPDHDDDTYRDVSGAMRDGATAVRAASDRNDFETAGAAVDQIERACADCHNDFRG